MRHTTTCIERRKCLARFKNIKNKNIRKGRFVIPLFRYEFHTYSLAIDKQTLPHRLKTPPAEVISNIWLEIVHVLKGQWDGIVGDSKPKMAQQHEFLIIWTTTPFLTSKYETPYWHF